MRFILATLHILAQYRGFSAFLIVVAGTTAFLVQNVLAWSAPQKIPWATDFELSPAVEVDSSGIIHIVWMVGNDEQRPVYYARGRANPTKTAIDWIEGPQNLGVSGYHYGSMAMRVDDSGTVHILVQDGTQPKRDRYFAYFRNEAQGTPGHWAAEYAGARCSYDPDLAVDTQGGVHGVCTKDESEGNYTTKYFYRPPGQAMGQGSWTVTNLLAPDGITRDSRITVANLGGQEYINIFFNWKPNDDWDLVHAYGMVGAPINARVLASDVIAYIPGTLSADPFTGQLVGGIVSGEVSRGYYTTLVWSSDGGANWGIYGTLDQGGDWWYNTRSLITRNYVTHILSEQWNFELGSPHKQIFYQTYNYSNGGLSGVQQFSNVHSTQPELGVNSPAAAAIWITDNTRGVTYVVGEGDGTPSGPTVTPTPAGPTPTPAPPTATPTPTPDPNKPIIEVTVGHGSNQPTRSNYQDIPVAITLLSGKADQYKVWEQDTGEPASYQSLALNGTTAVVSVDLTNPNGTACSNHMVNVRVRNSASGQESEAVPGMVTIDSGVDVTFDARNPNEGDPNQTNEPYYELYVEANEGECSSIQSVLSIRQTTPTSQTLSTVSHGIDGEVGLTSLPLISDVDGEYTIYADITDGSGWVETFQDTITLNSGQPQLASGGTMEVQDPTTNKPTTSSRTGKVDLAFQGIQVTTHGYQGNESGIWGICAINRLAADITPPPARWDDMKTECTSAAISGVQSNGEGYDFTMDEWNLTTGFPNGTTLESGTPLKIYACVMNGASCADEVFEGEVTLTQNILVQHTPTIYMPFVRR